MLPSPTLSFTIPSIQDDTVLQCRVYHPSCLNPTSVSQATEWKKKVAIVAHPYAPLGGCYDDPIVDVVAATILRQGWVVGTFNFRGAGSSKGRTSWQSKPEQRDYVSFIGFIVYYMHLLSPPSAPLSQPKFTQSDPQLNELSPVPSQALPPTQRLPSDTIHPSITLQSKSDDGRPRLLLAGYSYGSMITSQLPAILGGIIAPFQSPLPESAAAEIRLRAKCLAEQQNEIMKKNFASLVRYHKQQRPRSLGADDILRSPKMRGGVRMGGEEDPRRASHDSRRSRNSTIDDMDVVRRSIDRVRSVTKNGRFSPKRKGSSRSFASSHKGVSETSLGKDEDFQSMPTKVLEVIPGIENEFQTAYLLVSPLQGWVNTLATMGIAKFLGKDKPYETDKKFAIDPTLAIFGDDDLFVSVKKLRTWAGKLTGPGESFRYKEVANAGHFWHDHEALKILQEEVGDFVRTL